MNYSAMRQEHFDATGSNAIRLHQRKADRVHAALTLVVADKGPEWAVSASTDDFEAEVKEKLGVVFAPIIMMLIQLLLPIIIKFIMDKLTAKTFGGPAGLSDKFNSFRADAEAAL